MASKLQKVADDVKSLNRLFSAVKELAESFDEAGKLESLISSYKVEKDKMLKEVDKIKETIVDHEKGIALLIGKKEAAKKEAAQIIENAKIEKDNILSGAIQERNNLISELDGLKKEIETLQKEKEKYLTTVTRNIEVKKKELETFEEKVKQTKDSLKKLVS